MVAMRAATRRAWVTDMMGLLALGQQRADRKGHVGRPLGEPAHVPGIPGITVGDERLDAVASPGEPELLPGADPVQHLDLEPVATDAGRRDGRGDLLDQLDVVRAEAEPDRS